SGLLVWAVVLLGTPATAEPVTTLARTRALFRALRKGDERSALDLAKGANPRAADARGWTPLHYAARHGLTRAIHRLLLAGAKPDAADREGKTPLHLAAGEDHFPAVAALLAAGAAADRRDKLGETPLMHAATGSARVVQLLLKHGARPNARSSWGW